MTDPTRTPEGVSPEGVSPEALRRRHEPGSPPMVPVAIATIVFFGLLAAAMFAMRSAFHFMDGNERRELTERPPMAAAREVPPEPRIHPLPEPGLAASRAREAALLEEHAWVDRDQGVVRIPIERAMELTLERGLPYRRANEDGQGAGR